jgi:hypothetical protein
MGAIETGLVVAPGIVVKQWVHLRLASAMRGRSQGWGRVYRSMLLRFPPYSLLGIMVVLSQ